jgi:hypothetical protein
MNTLQQPVSMSNILAIELDGKNELRPLMLLRPKQDCGPGRSATPGSARTSTIGLGVNHREARRQHKKRCRFVV